jgi:hypothetical protein
MHNLGPLVAVIPLVIVFSVLAFEMSFITTRQLVRRRRKQKD